MHIKISLMPWQREFVQDHHRIKVLLAGRQAGKSHALMAALTKTCGTTKGRSAVICPVQNQSNDFFKLMIAAPNFERLLSHPPKLWPHPLCEFSSGHVLEFRSFENPRRLRGGKWTGLVVIDEANDLEGDEIKRVILPKVSATNAQVLIASTISSHNWLYDMFLDGQVPENKMLKSWLHITAEGYCFQGKAGRQRLEDLHSITPDWIWQSEYLVKPGKDNSVAFPFFPRCIIDDSPPESPQQGRKYILSVDLGRSRDNEVALVMDDQGLICDVTEFAAGDEALEHTVMSQRIAAMGRFWNAQVILDSTGKGGSGGQLAATDDSHVETYRRDIPDLIAWCWSGNRSNETKFDMVSHLMLMTEQGKIRCPKKFQLLISQMQQYRVLAAKGSNSTFGPPQGKGGPKKKDDAVCALIQACWAAKNNWFRHEGGTPIYGGLY